MILTTSVNLTLTAPEIIHTEPGHVATEIPAGAYIAEANHGQQPGWFALYRVDNRGNKVPGRLASVYLTLSPKGYHFISAGQ